MGEPINAYGPLFTGQKLTPAIRKAAQRTRDFAEFRLKARTPVRTGKLRKAWEVSLEGYGLRFRNSAHYGIYVEMGTYKMAARPMLGPTLDEARKVFASELSSELSKILAKKVQMGLDQGRFDASNTKDEAVYQALTSGLREVKGGFGDKDQSKGFGKMSKRKLAEWEQKLGIAEPTVKLYDQ